MNGHQIVARLHVTQDPAGFWMLSLEKDDGGLELLAHQFISRDLLMHETAELAASGPLSGLEIVADSPKPTLMATALTELTEYHRPAPKKAAGA